MFTPNQLEAMPIEIERLFRELEARIMSDIVRRIKINSEITRSADWQIHRLNQLGESKRVIKKYLKETLELSNKEIDHIYKDVVRQGYAYDEQLYKTKGKPFIQFEDNEGLQQLIAAVSIQTSAEFKNITKTLGFAIQQGSNVKSIPLSEYYVKTLDSAILDIASGAFDYNTVLKRTVSELTKSGLRTIDYDSGWGNRVDVAGRRAVMTGMSQVTAQINEENAEKLDTNYFEISRHIGARPSHQVWQGRVYTKEQLSSVCGLGTVTGIKGANCNHDYSPFIMGLSERMYTDEWLDEQNAKENTPVEYQGKKYTTYEATQRQRKLETQMRAERQNIKLFKEGGADETDIINARAKYRVTSAEYADFSKSMGLPQQRERVTIDGLGDVGKGKWKQPLHERDYGDIINMQGSLSDADVRKWYVTHDKKIPDLIDKTATIESQAKQACDMRNQHRTEARNLMADQEARKKLDITDPNKTFEELISHKMKNKNMDRENAILDILNTATKTRKKINKQLGLEE